MKVLGCLAIATVVVFAGASSAGAEPIPPSVTASPTTGLVDGQTVSVTASGFIAFTTPDGTIVPVAHECAPQFPPSAVFDFATANTVVTPLLLRYCTGLGSFPVTQSGVTSRDVAVRRGFVSDDGHAITCGAAPGDCLIVVTGAVPLMAGLASVPISFATTPTTKAQCRGGGWRHLVDARGRPFNNQGGCVSYVVHLPKR